MSATTTIPTLMTWESSMFYSLHAAMAAAQRFQYEEQQEFRRCNHPIGYYLGLFTFLQRLRDSRFKEWVRSRYFGQPGTEQVEKLLEAEIVDRYLDSKKRAEIEKLVPVGFARLAVVEAATRARRASV